MRERRSPPGSLLVLFPGALGDFLCCWPTLAAWHANGVALTVLAREAWFDALPLDVLRPLSIERREVADLFASGSPHPATRALFTGFAQVVSWTGSGDDRFARRLAEVSGAAVAVHPFRALRPDEHASQYYARCAGVAPLPAPLPLRPAAIAWTEALWQRHGLGENVLVIHAGSGSPRKNWEGMGVVAADWRRFGGQVVTLSGPAEPARAHTVPHDLALGGERLDRMGAVLARAARYLGNDSGISHLAGLVGARGLALFGPTDPQAWRPLGSGIRILHAPTDCARCGADHFCTDRLSSDAVLSALRAF